MTLVETYKDYEDVIFDVFSLGFGLRPDEPLVQVNRAWAIYYRAPLSFICKRVSAPQSATETLTIGE